MKSLIKIGILVIFFICLISCESNKIQASESTGVKHPIEYEGNTPIVGIAKGTDYATATAQAIENAGGLADLVKPGVTVLIKPNLCLPWYETPLATDYRCVAEVVRQVKALGAGRIIIAEGAFDPDPFSPENQRISRYGTITGVEFVDLNALTKDDCYYITPTNGITGKPFYMPKMYVDANVVITIPKLKTHEDGILSLGIKNVFGVPPKSEYSRPRAKLALHHEYGNIHNPMVDLNLIRLPDFTVIEGIVGGERSSPRVGKAVDSQIVIAGRNLASVDAVGAYLMGFNPQAVTHIRLAGQVGIGPVDLEKITVTNGKVLSKAEINQFIVQFNSPFPKGW